MKTTLAVLAAFAIATPAAASTIFTDTFVNVSYGGNVTPLGWTATDGTVEGLGPAFFGSLCTTAGSADPYCVDLDGSTGNAGVMSRSFNLNANVTYVASFDLSGSTRGDVNSVLVNFGTASNTYSLASSDPFATQTLSFTPTASGSYSLSFANAGGDNIGALLDRVSIGTAVPEPATWAMMVLGFGGLGATLRRRRAAFA